MAKRNHTHTHTDRDHHRFIQYWLSYVIFWYFGLANISYFLLTSQGKIVSQWASAWRDKIWWFSVTPLIIITLWPMAKNDTHTHTHTYIELANVSPNNNRIEMKNSEDSRFYSLFHSLSLGVFSNLKIVKKISISLTMEPFFSVWFDLFFLLIKLNFHRWFVQR